MHRNGFFRRDESTPKPGDFLHAQRKWRRFRETSLLRSQGDSSHAQRKWRRWKHLAEILPMNASHGVCICTLPVVEKTSFEIRPRGVLCGSLFFFSLFFHVCFWCPVCFGIATYFLSRSLWPDPQSLCVSLSGGRIGADTGVRWMSNWWK